jgi:hypothetical protein
MLLPLELEVTLELAYGTLHHDILEVASNFPLKVCEWFGILLNCFLDAGSDRWSVWEPSVVGELFAHSFNLGHVSELIVYNSPDASLDEKLQSVCVSTDLLVLGSYSIEKGHKLDSVRRTDDAVFVTL